MPWESGRGAGYIPRCPGRGLRPGSPRDEATGRARSHPRLGGGKRPEAIRQGVAPPIVVALETIALVRIGLDVCAEPGLTHPVCGVRSAVGVERNRGATFSARRCESVEKG